MNFREVQDSITLSVGYVYRYSKLPKQGFISQRTRLMRKYCTVAQLQFAHKLRPRVACSWIRVKCCSAEQGLFDQLPPKIANICPADIKPAAVALATVEKIVSCSKRNLYMAAVRIHLAQHLHRISTVFTCLIVYCEDIYEAYKTKFFRLKRQLQFFSDAFSSLHFFHLLLRL